MANALLKGKTSMSWGPSGLASAPAGAIAISGRITPKNGMPIEIEDSDGLTAALSFLPDGFDAELTFIYEANKAWPGQADVATLNLLKFGGAAGARVAYQVWVAGDPVMDEERKREATITYKYIYRPNCAAA